MAQLAELSLLTPMARSSNPYSSEVLKFIRQLQCQEKTQIMKKEARMGPFFKKEEEVLIGDNLLKLLRLIQSFVTNWCRNVAFNQDDYH